MAADKPADFSKISDAKELNGYLFDCEQPGFTLGGKVDNETYDPENMQFWQSRFWMTKGPTRLSPVESTPEKPITKYPIKKVTIEERTYNFKKYKVAVFSWEAPVKHDDEFSSFGKHTKNLAKLNGFAVALAPEADGTYRAWNMNGLRSETWKTGSAHEVKENFAPNVSQCRVVEKSKSEATKPALKDEPSHEDPAVNHHTGNYEE